MMNFHRARHCLSLATLILLGGGINDWPAASAAPPYRWPTSSVIPVLFSPLDWDIQSAEVVEEAAAISSAMELIQDFYAKSNNGKTFLLNPLEVVQGTKLKEGYGILWNGKNIYLDGVEFTGNIEHEVVSELYSRGFPTPPAQNEDGYSVLIFFKGVGGWAGGREFPHADGGWAILGDWCIDSLQGDVPEGDYWWSGRRLQIGAAAHELGHTFGLPHPDFYNGDWSTTIMGHWWNYPNTGLNSWEIDNLAANKASFFVVPEANSMYLSGLIGLVALVEIIRRKRMS